MELAGLGYSVAIDSEGELVSAASSGTSGSVAIKMYKLTEVSSNPSSRPSLAPSTSAQPSSSPSNPAQIVSLEVAMGIMGLDEVTDPIRNAVKNSTQMSIEAALEVSNPEISVEATVTIQSETLLTASSSSSTSQRVLETIGVEFEMKVDVQIWSPDSTSHNEASVVESANEELSSTEGKEHFISNLQSSGVQDLESVVGIEVEVNFSPSASPSKSPSTTPTESPSAFFDREFQITTTFDKFDFSAGQTWCATPKDVSATSIIRMRPCKSYSSTETNVQLWKRTTLGIRLARPTGDLCLMKNSLFLRLGICGSDTDRFSFNVDDDAGTISIIGQNGKNFFIGYDPQRKFSQLRLYKRGAINPTLTLWETVYVDGS